MVRQDYHESEKFTRGTQCGAATAKSQSPKSNQIIRRICLPGFSLGRACLPISGPQAHSALAAQVSARARGEGPPARVPRAARAFIDEQQVREHVNARIGPCARLASVA